MRRSSLEGIILRIKPSGESDLILWIFTPAIGPMVAIAKRGAKSVKRFGGRIMLFNRIVFEYSRPKDNELAYMESARILEIYPGVFKSEFVFGRTATISEVLLAAWGESDPAEKPYLFLLDYLRRADTGKTSLDRHILDEFVLLDVLGHRPFLDKCAACAGELTESKKYSVNEGGAVCELCATEEFERLKGRGGSRPIEVGAAVKGTIKKLFRTEGKLLDRIKFSAKAAVEAQSLATLHFQALLGRTPKSIQFLEKLNSK